MWTQIFPFRVGHDVGVSWDSSGGRWWKAGPGEQDSHGCPDSRWCRAPRGPHSGLETVSLWRPGSRRESRRPVSAGDLWGHSAPVCPQSLCGRSEVTDSLPSPALISLRDISLLPRPVCTGACVHRAGTSPCIFSQSCWRIGPKRGHWPIWQMGRRSLCRPRAVPKGTRPKHTGSCS